MPSSPHIRRDLPRFTPLRSITALMLREMGSTYGTSPGGYVWAILQPIGMIVILSLAFSLLLRTPSLGTSFILFYATGFLPFDVYNQLSNLVGKSLFYSRSMLAYPRVIWLDAIIARVILNTITLLTVFCIVITGIIYFAGTRTVVTVQPIILGLLIAITFGIAVGLVNCFLGGLFPVWNVIYKIIKRPMFLASGVLFIMEDMPPAVQNILWWNPMIHATGIVRSGFYSTYYASYASPAYCFAVSFVAIVVGLIFVRAYHEKILER